MHYLDEGPRRRRPGRCCCTASRRGRYLYRTMIPVLAAAGHRAVAPDLVGFGRSDKPARARPTTPTSATSTGCARCLDAARPRATSRSSARTGAACIGLRLVGEHPDRFARVVAANTFLPDRRHARPARRSSPGSSSRQEVPELPDRAHRQRRLHHRPRARGRSPPTTRPFPDESLQGGRAPVPAAGADLARRPRRPSPTGGRGRRWPASTSRSSPPSATATRSPRAPTACSRGTSPARRPAAHDHRGRRPLPPGGPGPELADVVAEFIAATPSA